MPQFYVVRMSIALFNPRSANAVLGLNVAFGWNALGLAEAMAPDADGAVVVAGDEDRALMTELFLCRDCYLMKDLNLAQLQEARHDEREGD